MFWRIEHNTRAFQMSEGQVAFVGRHKDSQIRLVTKRTSEHHGVFFVQDGLLHYIDHGKPVAEKNYYGSSNGTYQFDGKNFVRINPMNEILVEHGDQFRMFDEVANEQGVTLENQLLKISIHRKKDENITPIGDLTPEQAARFKNIVAGVLEKKKREQT